MDGTKRPLLIPPQFSTYAEKHQLFQLYEKLLHKLIINQPADPLQYMVDVLTKSDYDVPQIILCGPPGSGKTVLAQAMCAELNCVSISYKDLELRKMPVSHETDGKDEWLDILKERLQRSDCVTRGWLLEGVPQTRYQAQVLQAAGIMPKHFVVLDVLDRVLLERAMGKRIDGLTGDIYHTTFDRPTDVETIRRLVLDPDSAQDVMVTRLKAYHREIEGIISCFKRIHKTIDADQPKNDIYSQIIDFLKTKARVNAPHTPRVLLLGPIGSGKHVQASLLARKYQLINVSCGALIKEALANKSEVGEAMRPYIERGSNVPDELVLAVLKQRLGQLDAVQSGWVLHGYPKTRTQAEILVKAGYEPSRVILLDVPTDISIERLSLRGVDPISGQRYHMLYAPPQTAEVKDRLQTHPKDKERDVHEELIDYQSHVADIVEYFENTQRVNADQDLQTVFESVESIVVNPLPEGVVGST